MAKGKNLNPADALRKAQRKKELKKNKAERQKNRDFALVKKDTTELEDEIVELEGIAEPTNVQRARIAELKSELSKITKKKDEYVEAHPEQRGLVYKRRRDKEKDGADDGEGAKVLSHGKTKRNLFNKHGLPRHPERSVHYDPIMNPYGMPPPGMPYVERALLPGEIDSEAEEADGADSSESDDDIAMPEGPPPGASNDEDGESDDDIPLPEGPPPGAALEKVGTPLPPLPSGPPPLPSGPPPFMPPFAPNLPPQMVPFPGISCPPPPAFPMSGQPFAPQFLPPPPPPPPGFSYPPASIPPPPPGFFPRRGQHSNQSVAAMQDPLSGIPHQTYQAHRAARYGATPTASSGSSSLPTNPNLPARPVGAVPGNGSPSRADVDANATVSAAPQLRDLKKESTAFVPAALKRKKVGAGAGGTASGRVNAAPSIDADGGTGNADGGGDGSSEGVVSAPKPDLLGSLREKFGPMASASTAVGEDGGEAKAKKRKVERPKDDYDKFLAEMGDMLGTQ